MGRFSADAAQVLSINPGLLRASEGGDQGAQFDLARTYLHVYKDFAKAKKWYERAASRGHGPSMLELASFYHHKQKNLSKAIRWYRQALENNDREISKGALFCLYQIAQTFTAVSFEEFVEDPGSYLDFRS